MTGKLLSIVPSLLVLSAISSTQFFASAERTPKLQINSSESLSTNSFCSSQNISDSNDRKYLPCSFIKHNENSTLFLGKSLHLKMIDSVKLLQNRPTLCQHETDLLIVIISLVHKRENRDAIRQAWLNTSLFNVTTKKRRPRIVYTFVTGTGRDEHNYGVTDEFRKHGDILQFDSYDRNQNDITSTTAATLNWVRKYCSNAKYILKTNGLLMVNPFILLEFEKIVAKKMTKSIFGIRGKEKPATGGDKAVPIKMWPWPSYPEYLAGDTFLADRAAALAISEVMTQLPYFPLDEIFFSGIVAPLAGVNLEEIDRFLQTSYKKEFWKANTTLAYLSANSRNMAAEWKEYLWLSGEGILDLIL